METLPPELIVETITYLSIKELACAQLVSASWNILIRSTVCDALLWRPFVLKINPNETLEDTRFIAGNTWRERLQAFSRVDRTRLEKLLSIEKGASSEAIKKAYRRTAIRYHPSRYPPVTDPPFEKISDAYYILSDPQKRAIYDVYGIEGIECLEPVPSGLHYNVFSN